MLAKCAHESVDSFVLSSESESLIEFTYYFFLVLMDHLNNDTGKGIFQSDTDQPTTKCDPCKFGWLRETRFGFILMYFIY